MKLEYTKEELIECEKDAYTRGYRQGLYYKPKSEWIEISDERVMCSRCTFIHEKWFSKFNFCPNCGADMRGSEVEE